MVLLAMANATADEIVLDGSSKLSGKVTAITEGGGVQIESPVASEPLSLKPGAVKRVVFAETNETPAPGGTRLTLQNGDHLPCELKSMDDSTLMVATSFAGDLKIPRAILSTMDLGIHEEKVLYDGVTGLEGWTNDKWKSQDNRFTCNGSGRMSRSFDLPDQFAIRFTLSWRGNPNFQATFADLPDSDSPTVSRYAFQFNNGGIELRRLGGQRPGASTTLIQLNNNRQPDSFPNSRMDVEIRVNRGRSELWLLVDGVLEGHRADPVKDPPAGGGLSFSTNAGGDTEQTVSNLRITSWDADSDRYRTEDRGDTTSDSLIFADGDRYSGKLESIRTPADGKTVLSFKSPVLEQPMTIPARNVSTVFFKAPKNTEPAPPPSPFLLRLQGGGSLQVDSCSFSGNRIEARHARLGALSLKRSSVASIEQAGFTPDPKESQE
ncbi:hypothetical protein llg_02440 [Luteolibacter sp. LG18]|nr:hypothetical protein llg_02440 [Luteolibacter sp. LG18]